MSTMYLHYLFLQLAIFFSLQLRPILFFAQDIILLRVYNKIVMSSWPSICVSECCAAVCHNIAKFHRCKMDVTLVKSVAPLSTHSSFCFFFFACQIFALGIILQENQNKCKLSITQKMTESLTINVTWCQ